jgi:4-hydroxy-4-methyl-2-oxoglutarate aldolase
MPTSILSDAMNRMNSMSSAIKPLAAEVYMLGQAVTVQAMVGCNLMSHIAIYKSRPGDVIVFDARAHLETSVWGYLQTRASMLRKLGGVVIDGSVRDSREIRQSRFPVFCRGVTPAGPHKGWGDNLNVPVQCGQVCVHPGDIVVGDADGVVVIPIILAEEIAVAAESRKEMESEWFDKIERGISTIEAVGLKERIRELGIEDFGDV